MIRNIIWHARDLGEVKFGHLHGTEFNSPTIRLNPGKGCAYYGNFRYRVKYSVLWGVLNMVTFLNDFDGDSIIV